jgi:glucose-1-phosphate cytidylyltransferase
MVEIGGKPILWHILSIYSHFGFNDFLIACGYKGHVIKDYFNNFYVHNSDWVVDLRNGAQEVVQPLSSQWRVGVHDTGLHTATGGRLRRLRKWLGNETFLVLRQSALGRLPGPRVLGKAADGPRLDQRRLFCLRSGRL